MAWCSYFRKSGSIRLMIPEAEQTKHTNTPHQHALIKTLVSIRKFLRFWNTEICLHYVKKFISYLREKMCLIYRSKYLMLFRGTIDVDCWNLNKKDNKHDACKCRVFSCVRKIEKNDY
jgi:hypothetical protein